ncbi:MAG: aldo/keto reductase [Firmicutes bacterium]|nr:aldo/keto reductase [Bacillota bacterium]
MKYNTLGRTGIKVSELCFGILPMGPLQADMPVEDGGKLLLSAMEQGITFFDTAQMYGSYPHLRYALDRYQGEVVITGKSVADSYEKMAQAIEEGLQALGRDYFDVFLLHAARVGEDILQQRAGAWECLQDYKRKGYLRAIGVSTHNAAAVDMLAENEEADVVFCLYNKSGLGIISGGPAEMLAAAQHAHQQGKGIYSMKLLGGGNLLSDIIEAFAFGRKESCFAAHAVGMVKPQELEMNLRFFNDRPVDAAEVAGIKNNKQWQLMYALCKGCGNCVANCHSQALKMVEQHPQVILENCVLCGYCAADCPEFAIRVR